MSSGTGRVAEARELIERLKVLVTGIALLNSSLALMELVSRSAVLQTMPLPARFAAVPFSSGDLGLLSEASIPPNNSLLSSLLKMVREVLSSCEHLQIDWVIVCSIAVPMMDMTAVRDRPIDGLPDNAMQAATIALKVKTAEVVSLASKDLLGWANDLRHISFVPGVSQDA